MHCAKGDGSLCSDGTASSPTRFSGDASTDKYPSGDTTVGLPMARAFDWSRPPKSAFPASSSPTQIGYTPSTPQVTSQAQSRPYFLHRPFRSVAELGCVFSDTPWRNLDFATAESGSTALLDVFCVNEEEDVSGLVAGKVNLNTRHETVLQAILAGGCIDLAQPQASHATGRLDPTTSRLLARALITRTTNTAANGAGPLVNVSDLVGKFVSKNAIRTPNISPAGTAIPPLDGKRFPMENSLMMDLVEARGIRGSLAQD